MTIRPENSQDEQSGLIPIAVLQEVVSKLLVHSEREALTSGFIELIKSWHKPQEIQLFACGLRGLVSHRGQSLADIMIRDVLDPDSLPMLLSNNPIVYAATSSKEVQTVNNQDDMDLYVPLMQGDTVSSVLVLKGISFKPVNELIWKQMLSAYNHLNRMLYSAEIDALTGLLNRLAFDRLLNREPKESTKLSVSTLGENRHVYFALIDIDFFKKINDNFGHLYGDEVLILLAREMSDAFRSNDWLFRYGGEEFAVVLNDLDHDEAYQALERFRERIANMDFSQVGQVTVSVGYSRMFHSEPASSLIDRADQALYYAKNHGRNQTLCYEDLVEQGLLEHAVQEIGDIELF